ncbi:hypothetical protein D9758_004373 [Tetrapyrgos nigripes]|uniref:FAD-binding PCMH-type domain-containing protein n=1 Tax=Tetrapyrgos nigripes TaxID=182062 RepID=A0A8H5GMV8_9AGAR|nr:hypothetical protein D9758_004373 [Tetrapyrgos nigripes]
MMSRHSKLRLALFRLSLTFSLIVTSQAQTQEDPPPAAATKACQILNETLPGLVFFPGATNYASDNFHYAATSTQNSTCTVEPLTNEDVSAILKIVGQEDVRSPFAVKGGGHTSNVGHSSTTGVMISLVKFDQITANDPSTTVTLGPAATWDQVYAKLEPLNLTVVGGRIPGVGVGVVYDRPVEQPPAVFGEILSLPLTRNTTKARTLTDLTLGASQSPQTGYTQHIIPTLHYTVPIMRAMKTQVDAAVAKAIAEERSIATIAMSCEPYINDFAHSVDSAYPHSPSRPVTPGHPTSFYNDVADRDYFEQLIQEMSGAIHVVVIQEGQGLPDDIHYPNYALADTLVELIYGENLPRLREIKERADPTDVMGLSGGFKI